MPSLAAATRPPAKEAFMPVTSSNVAPRIPVTSPASKPPLPLIFERIVVKILFPVVVP